jgi:hypothetical protein
MKTMTKEQVETYEKILEEQGLAAATEYSASIDLGTVPSQEADTTSETQNVSPETIEAPAE